MPEITPTGCIDLPAGCDWLPADKDQRTAQVSQLVRRAQRYIGHLEDPLGSNRGPLIDAWLRRGGVSERDIERGRGYWCAAWAGSMWLDSGFPMPPGFASCDQIMNWGKATLRFTRHTPSPGALVLYGPHALDATHIGLVMRTGGAVMSAEANTTVEGSKLERNGTAIALKLVTPHDPVLGFVHPFPPEAM